MGLSIFKYFFSCKKIYSKFQSNCMIKRFPNSLQEKKFSFKTHSDNEISQVSSNNIEKRNKVFPRKKTKVCYTIEEENKQLVETLKRGEKIYLQDNEFLDAYVRFKKDVKLVFKKLFYNVTKVKLKDLNSEFFPRETDILIVGGGALGLLIAYQIRHKAPHGPSVFVVDKDLDSPYLSANLAKGTLWQQFFTEKEEIEMTQYFVEFLNSFNRFIEPEKKSDFIVNYDPLGALYLADETNCESLIQKSQIMKTYGIPHKLLDNKTLKSQFPWLNTEGILFGSLGLCHEGLFNPWKFLTSLKCKAINLGVTFLNAEVIDFGLEKDIPKRAIVRLPNGSYSSIDFCYCVFASGMETLKMLEIINNEDISPIKINLPLIERKRFEYFLHCPDGPGLNTPIIINPDGVYFRREGILNSYVAGVASVDYNDEDDVVTKFDKEIKPFLMKRIPQFNNLDLITNWVDVYETNTVNNIGVLGFHPDERRFLFVNGFCNLGLQYLPAVGRAVMELILYDTYQTIDFSQFTIESLYERNYLEAKKKQKELLEAQQKVSLIK